MPDDSTSPKTREVVGIFFEADKLRSAVDDLLALGFDRSELGLLAGEFTVKQRLGDVYAELNKSADKPNAPCAGFVLSKAGIDTEHAVFGGLLTAGIAAAGGAVVASAAVLGGALASAVAGTAAVGSIGALMSRVVHQSHAEHLEAEIEKGHLLLFVRARDAAHEKSAREVLGKHSASDVRVCIPPGANP